MPSTTTIGKVSATISSLPEIKHKVLPTEDSEDAESSDGEDVHPARAKRKKGKAKRKDKNGRLQGASPDASDEENPHRVVMGASAEEPCCHTVRCLLCSVLFAAILFLAWPYLPLADIGHDTVAAAAGMRDGLLGPAAEDDVQEDLIKGDKVYLKGVGEGTLVDMIQKGIHAGHAQVELKNHRVIYALPGKLQLADNQDDKYAAAPTGTVCPVNGRIVDARTCRRAARSFGLTFTESATKIWPKGCAYNKELSILNWRKEGPPLEMVARSGAQSVCSATTMAAAAMPAFPEAGSESPSWPSPPGAGTGSSAPMASAPPPAPAWPPPGLQAGIQGALKAGKSWEAAPAPGQPELPAQAGGIGGASSSDRGKFDFSGAAAAGAAPVPDEGR